MLRFEFAPGALPAVEAAEMNCPKPSFPDGAMRNSRVAYSDERCEIISNRMGNNIVLCKTLPANHKKDFYQRIQQGSDEPTDRVQYAVYQPDDMYAIQSALEKLGFEVSGEWMAALAGTLLESAQKVRNITLVSDNPGISRC